MKVIYYTQAFFSDCDLPLIREFQKREIAFRCYIPVQTFRRKSGIIDFEKLKKRSMIYKASKYEEFDVYKDYVDLDKIYIINLPDSRGRLQDMFVWVYSFIHMLSFRPHLFHFNWQLEGRERWLYYLPVKKIMTVHDPISHSSVTNDWEENSRLMAFKNAKRFILLSDVLKREFSKNYSIPEVKIDIARMGEFSFLRYLRSLSPKKDFQYILFFGQILSYKGLEYLCEAMIKVHEVIPHLHLVIAGRGKMYFDYSKYENLNYFHLKNEYISIVDLSSLIRGSLFTICPYKDATQSGVVQTSFSCGTPMIVTDVGALPKAVTHNVTGLVVPPCDIDSLKNSIIELANNEDQLKMFRRNIVEEWQPSMEWSSIVDIYINSYNKINEA